MQRTAVALVACACVLLLTWHSTDPIVAQAQSLLLIEIDGEIDLLTADHVARGLDQAHESDVSLVVIELDTPGGFLDSTRDIVEVLIASEIPAVVWVSPAGARAASAGTFIAAAANFAVMAPGTSIGAATPVTSDGNDLPKTLSRKISEDTRAFIRSVAQTRGRNAGALEDTVLTARSYSSQEAADLGVIDFVAADLGTLLSAIDGRETMTAAGTVTVESADLEVRKLDATLLERTLGVLANPNVILALFLIGGLAVVAEFAIPGMFGPGILGVILLILAFVGFSNVPGSWVGVGLIALAMALFYVETIAPGFGAWGVGGVVSLLLGSIFLFGNFLSPSDLPEPRFMASPVMIAIMTGLAIAGWVLFIRAVRTEGGTSSGYQSNDEIFLEGQWGVAMSDLAPSGKVWVASEEWSAATDPGVLIKEGDEIRVTAVYGQVLRVEKLEGDS